MEQADNSPDRRPPQEGRGSRSRKSERGRVTTLLWLLSIPLLAYLFFRETGGDLHLFWSRVLRPLIRLVSIMAGTLALSALIEANGWNRVVAMVSRPLMRLGRLSDWSGTAFTTSFLSGIAGSTLLWNAYKEGRISKKEMYLASLLNVGLPSYFLHLPVTLAIIVPLAGTAGAIYMAITFLAAILRSAFILLLGRLLLKESKESVEERVAKVGHERSRTGGKRDFASIFKKYMTMRLGNILLYTVPIYILVVLLQIWGLFDWLKEASAHLVATNMVPVEGISVVVFSIVAEFAAGAAAAGAMQQQGVLTTKETVIALVLGNVIATPVRAIRHQLPRYIGIFKPATGIRLLLMGQALRIVSVMISCALYLLVA